MTKKLSPETARPAAKPKASAEFSAKVAKEVALRFEAAAPDRSKSAEPHPTSGKGV